jgi:putative cardiolipin synthase
MKKINLNALAHLLAPVIATFILGACSSVPIETSDKTVTYADKDLSYTPLGKMATQLEAGKPEDESGFLLLDRGHDALAWRLFMADNAQRTLDAQYFLWKNDRLGRVFIQHLLDAAERGVRVRVLVDDSMTESDPEYLAKLGVHPNAEVRLYKPFGPKHNSFVMRWIDFIADFKRLNRRMHNKLYVADDSMVITGGRNIGEDYFEYLAPDVFRSRDLLAVGNIASDASDAFDMFWNSEWAVPIAMVVDPLPTTEEFATFKQELDQASLDHANYPPGYNEVGSIEQVQTQLGKNLMWGEARLVYDTVPGENGEPEAPKDQNNLVGQALSQVAKQAKQEVIIESAYLILPDETMQQAKALTDRGITTIALTNSLAANNHTTAFVGYRKQRKDLMETFSELYEYRPDAAAQTELYNELAPGKPVPHLGLHAKTAVFDRITVFVGSYNLDPRSVNLNTEIGFLVTNEELAQAVANSILLDASAGNSWQVRLNSQGQTEWVTIVDGKESIEPNPEPLTTEKRRGEADLMEPLTPESQM